MMVFIYLSLHIWNYFYVRVTDDGLILEILNAEKAKVLIVYVASQQLISTFVYSYSKSQFSHDTAHMNMPVSILIEVEFTLLKNNHIITFISFYPLLLYLFVLLICK